MVRTFLFAILISENGFIMCSNFGVKLAINGMEWKEVGW